MIVRMLANRMIDDFFIMTQFFRGRKDSKKKNEHARIHNSNSQSFSYLCRPMKKQTLHILALAILLLLSQNVFAQRNKHQKNKKAETETSCPLIDSIIDFSMTKLGCAYQAGGTGPRSFDCSGFMYYTFGQFNIKLGRSSRDQFLMGERVEKNDIRRGDLVFWYRGKGYIGHVGMVVEVDSAHNFKFIHSATYGKGVRFDYSTSKWYSSTYAGARRIIDCDGSGRAFMIEGSKKTELDNITMPVASKDSQNSANDSVSAKPVAKPEVSEQAQPKYTYHKIKKGETLSTIAKKHHVTVAQIKKWNHLRSDMIHEGSRLKIQVPQKKKPAVVPKAPVQPAPVAKDTATTQTTSPAVQKPAEPTAPKAEPAVQTVTQPKIVYHKIKSGETLSAIARKYHVTVDQIKKWNHLKSDMIHEGDKLKITVMQKVTVMPTVQTEPTSANESVTATTSTANTVTSDNSASAQSVTHKIEHGESLYSISRKYNVTVDQIKQWNQLNSDMIHEGDNLTIMVSGDGTVTTSAVAPTSAPTAKPAESAAPAPQPQLIYHKIQQGETLSTIARKYHVTVNQIKQWNHLKSDMIREDAKLKIYKK